MNNRTLKLMALSTVALLAAGNLLAYTVVTRDGHRIEARSKPEIRGVQALMRLEPSGQLVVIHEERIDWVRTEAVNKTRPPVIVPSKAKVAQEVEQPTPQEPIEHEIRGGAGQVAAVENPDKLKTAAAPEQKNDAQEQENAMQDSRSEEAVLLLQREYAKVRSMYEKALVRKEAMEHELAELKSRQASHAAMDHSEQQTIRDLEVSIGNLSSRIAKYETRMNDIRGEAIQHGGSIN